jgi:hypothetical protein
VTDATSSDKLALLIDGDNLRADFLPIIMREASTLGTVVIRRLYGHFGSASMRAWQKPTHEYALTPVHVLPATKGKNATDMKLAIEAVDMLHERDLDGFCLASSDSDFMALASRIRENGLAVYGFGEKKAAAPHVAAYDRFFYCDLLLEEESGAKPERRKKKLALPTRELLAAINEAAGEDGWALLGSVRQLVIKRMPDFDQRNYGYRKLSELMADVRGIELSKDRRSVRPTRARQG